MVFDDRLTRTLKIVTLIVLSLFLAAVAGLFLLRILPVVIVLIGAVFFAYLVYPAVNGLERLRFPRWLAITSIYLVLAAMLGAGFAFIFPTVAGETKTFTHDFPGIVQQSRDMIINAHTSVLSAVPIEARKTAANLLDQFVRQVQATAGGLAGKALQIVLSVAAVITGLIIVPVLAFYILLDSDRLRDMAVGLFPARYRPQTLLILHDIDVVVGGFIRGQLIVGAVVAILVTTLLVIAHIKYAFLIGLFAGIVDIIPYVGAFAGAVPAVVIAFLTHGAGSAFLVIAGFVGIYEIEGHIVAPAVVGQKVGLSPLIVIIALLIGAETGGVGGMLISVPIAGIIRVLWNRFAKPQVVMHPAQSLPTAPESIIITKE